VVKQARDDTSAGRTDRRPRTGKLWVIERVEELELQLVFEPLAEARVLHQRQVGLGLPWIAKDATARISVGTGVVGSGRKGGGMDPVVGGGFRELPAADPIRAVTGAGRKQALRLGDGERQSGA